MRGGNREWEMSRIARRAGRWVIGAAVAAACVAACAEQVPRERLEARRQFANLKFGIFIRALIKRTNGKGMNLLLNVAPRADGKLPDQAMGILASLSDGD